MGKDMKASKGTADPKKSAQLLNKLINHYDETNNIYNINF